MFNSFIKRIFATFAFALILGSFAYAGNDHCPVFPPPPPPPGEGGRGVAQMTTDDSTIDQMIKGFWEFLGSDIF